MLKVGKLYKDNVANFLIVLKILELTDRNDYKAIIVKSDEGSKVGQYGIIDKSYEGDFVPYQQKVRRLKWWK